MSFAQKGAFASSDASKLLVEADRRISGDQSESNLLVNHQQDVSSIKPTTYK
jgi:hypothetical protein